MISFIRILVCKRNKNFEITDRLLFSFVLIVILNMNSDWAVLVFGIDLE